MISNNVGKDLDFTFGPHLVHIWSTFATFVITVIYHLFLTNNGYVFHGQELFPGNLRGGGS